MARKPKAADRTVDMFTGMTNLQAQESAIQDIQESTRTVHPPLEECCDQYRQTAFDTQEYVSKTWADSPELKAVPQDQLETSGKEVFRITRKGPWSFLENLRLGKDGLAYHWTGFMFRTANQHELTNVCVKASKEMVNK